MVGKNACFGNQLERNKMPKGMTGINSSRIVGLFQRIGPVAELNSLTTNRGTHHVLDLFVDEE